jgi:error-prone DNA polymerase
MVRLLHLVAYKLRALNAVLVGLQARVADAGDMTRARRSRNFC